MKFVLLNPDTQELSMLLTTRFAKCLACTKSKIRLFITTFLCLNLVHSFVFAQQNSKPMSAAEAENIYQLNKSEEMGYTLAHRFLDPRNCLYEQKRFVGCLEAIEMFFRLKQKNILFSNRVKDFYLKIDSSIQVIQQNGLVIEINHHLDEVNPELIHQIKELKLADYTELFQQQDMRNIFTALQSDILLEMRLQINRFTKKQWNQIIDAYLENADAPHSVFYNLAEINNQISEKEFYGVGIKTYRYATTSFIHDIIPEGPAEKANIKTGSSILTVDKKSTEFMSSEELKAALRGPEGSEVVLKLKKDGKVFEKTLLRQKIANPFFKSRVIEIKGIKFGYLSLNHFFVEVKDKDRATLQSAILTAASLVESEVQNLKKENIYGLILDLRGNRGGHVDLALAISSLFLPANSVFTSMKIFGTEGQQIRDVLTNAQPIYQERMAILIDAKSASATEMLTASFKYYERALVVGRTSFGKGSFQNFTGLVLNDGYSWNKSAGLFYSPSGDTNQTTGVTPHLMSFKNPEHAAEENRQELREKDMYLIPLEAKKIRVSAFTKPPENKISVNESCFAKENPEAKYNEISKNDQNRDMQLLSAIAGLNCLSHRPRAENGAGE